MDPILTRELIDTTKVLITTNHKLTEAINNLLASIPKSPSPDLDPPAGIPTVAPAPDSTEAPPTE